MNDQVIIAVSVSLAVICYIGYVVIDRLIYGRWIDRPNSREVKS